MIFTWRCFQLKIDEINKLEKEKMKLLTRVNDLLEGMIEEEDDAVRKATSELVKQLKSNIGEMEQEIKKLEQEGDKEPEVEENNSSDEEIVGEDEKESGQEVEEERYIDYEYTEEPNVSIGRTDDGTILAVYDKRRKKQK